MNKLTFGITVFVVYETFTVAALDACPLPRDEVCVNRPKVCREEQHIDRDMTVNASSGAIGIVQMVPGGPIMSDSGALTFTRPQQYIDIPHPYYKRAASLYQTT
jgi:hypothetical protein